MQRTTLLRLAPFIALTLAALIYLAAWGWHLYADTASLRGFWGDGSMEFLVHLSRSYIFTGDSPNFSNMWVHLFPVGNPRDGALFLNALGLQAALWLHITDPATLKYIFVFWQYASPGFLYLGLFFALWRAGRAAWMIFPLLSWAVCSVPVDWNAVNNARWAVPVFWMHVMLCLHARPRDTLWAERWPLLALGILGALMWAGLYESVVGQLGLMMAAGAVIWRREGNNRPFLYALAALPGSVRAILSYLDTGANASNGFHGLILPTVMAHPVAILMMLALLILPLLARLSAKARLWAYGLIPALFVYFGMRLLQMPPLYIWLQVNFRFDYIVMAMALMTLAALCRCWNKMPEDWPTKVVLPAALLGLLTGALFWQQQTVSSTYWGQCMARFAATKGDKPLVFGADLEPLIKIKPELMQAYGQRTVGACLWDWVMPWYDLLTSHDGRVSQWSLFTFWQAFEFVEKDGVVFLHTNNWTLNSPSVQASEGWLPLKTALYDLTPLYEKVGLGPLYPRTQCLPTTAVEPNWRHHLESLTDDKRRAMLVCPSHEAP